MNKKMISKIYDKCVGSIPDSPETEEAYRLSFNKICPSDIDGTHEALSSVANAYQKQGFIKGFEFAMSLLIENGGSINE